MTFGSNVAPPKIPLRPKPQPWNCRCPIAATPGTMINPGYLVACPACGARRPD